MKMMKSSLEETKIPGLYTWQQKMGLFTQFISFVIFLICFILNIIGKLENIILPTEDIITNTPWRNVPSPKIFSRLKVFIVLGLVNEAPIPNNIPATGRTDIGKKKDLPIFCTTENILLFINK